MAEMKVPVMTDGETEFVALGGIWLDEICTPGKETLYDVPGGSVTFGISSKSFNSASAELTVSR